MSGGGGGGGGGSSPTYTSIDGQTFADPNKAADRDRQLQLGAAFGYDRTSHGAFEQWLATQAPDIQTNYNTYNNQGLSAADYRSEQEIKKQQAEAEAAEAQRQANIQAGRTAVDNTFSSFDDNYFGGLSQSVLDYYLPQLQDQYGKAQEQLSFSLARKGNTKSSAAAQERADLTTLFDTQRSGITNRAADAANSAREGVSAAKSNLYNYAQTAADPAAVNTQLASENTRLRASTPELTPLGKVFSDYLTPIIQTAGQGIAAEANGYQGFGTGLFGRGRGSSAANVVGY